MQFGVKKKDAPEPTGGKYLRRFAKGETKVRFLDEPDEWIMFKEHFTPDRKGFPCTMAEGCPGCTSDVESVRRAGRKYAAQVLLIKSNQVLPFAIPVTLAERLAIRAERNGGTLVNRDYVVLRSGDGFDTEYDVDQEDKYPLDLAELHKKIQVEIQDCFLASFNEVWGSVDNPVRQVSKAEAREATQDENVPFSRPTSQSESAAKSDEEELTEAQIRAMDVDQLAHLCSRAGLSVDMFATKDELIELLLKEFGA